MNIKIRPWFKFLLLVLPIILVSWLLNISDVENVKAADRQCSYHEQAYQGLELTNLEQELKGTGLIGRIHGAVSPSKLFVLSVREPEDFFNYYQFSLIPGDETTLNTLSQIKRHDQVCIQGRFIENPSPQKHILVKSIQVLESWSTPGKFEPYQRETKLTAELVNNNSFIGKVHAIEAGGQILVVEYQDAVMPIFVESPEDTKDLFRGDIIRLSYDIQKLPTQPTHLRLKGEKPVEVLDAIADWHNQEKVLTGELVKFSQSPQLQFDVYALGVETQGVKRYFTLVNFEDSQEFKNIRDKLAQIWEDNLDTASAGRNMLFNSEVVLEVRGKINVVSPAQANPQILLDKAEDINLVKL